MFIFKKRKRDETNNQDSKGNSPKKRKIETKEDTKNPNLLGNISIEELDSFNNSEDCDNFQQNNNQDDEHEPIITRSHGHVICIDYSRC
jgi:hypothetical protein